MVTLDYSHLTSVLWGVCKGFQARLDELEAWQAQRGQVNMEALRELADTTST